MASSFEIAARPYRAGASEAFRDGVRRVNGAPMLAAGLGQTFTPSIIGFGAVLDNLSGLLDSAPMAATIAGVTAAWMLIWSFLSGGVIDRLARRRRTRTHGFFAACGVHFWRFLRLGIFAWLIYVFLFLHVHHWIFDDAYPALIEDLT